jgi:hypothetical protein
MRKILIILFSTSLTSCYFGANESGGKITKNFHLIGWDEKDWQIVYNATDNDIYNPEKIIIRHDVFAVGHNDDFIIAKQHPCENTESHLIDFDSLRANKNITNFYIIEILNGNNNYQIHKYKNELEFKKGRIELRVSKDLEYKFYDKELE